MSKKFVKEITKEGKRKVINIPKKYDDDFDYKEKVLVSKLDYSKLSKEELEEILKEK